MTTTRRGGTGLRFAWVRSTPVLPAWPGLTLVLLLAGASASSARAEVEAVPVESEATGLETSESEASGSEPSGNREEQAVEDAAGAAVLKSTSRVREICLAARPVERVHPDKRDAFRQERRRVMRQLYKVRVPPRGFTLAPYVAETGELPIDSGAPLRTLHGALALTVPSDDSAIFVLTAAQAKHVAELAAQGQLRLDYYFLLSDDLGSPCQGSVATQVFSVATTPVAFVLLGPDGEELTRDESLRADAHREALGGFTGVPAVFVGPVTTEPGADAAALARRLEMIQEPLKACYEKRVIERPGAAGTVVLGVEVGSSGALQSIDVIADALGDSPLLKCIEQELHRVRFAGIRGLPLLFRVPVEMRRVPARTNTNPAPPSP